MNCSVKRSNLLYALLALVAFFALPFSIYGCGTEDRSVDNSPVVALTVEPTAKAVGVGLKTQLTAFAIQESKKITDVTSDAEWTSSDESIASVEDGVIAGVAVGKVTITATYGGFTATTSVTVIDVEGISSIFINPAKISLPEGNRGDLKATAIYEDGSTSDVTLACEWNSDAADVAAVKLDGDKAVAVVSGESIGESTITASLGDYNATSEVNVTKAIDTRQDIIVLYTNDVHGSFEKSDDYPDRIGFSSLAAYRTSCYNETPYVMLVDVGDAVQGETICTVSKGQYLIDIMNAVDYDFGVLGNHEFDYGMDQLINLLDSFTAKCLDCNIKYTGQGTSELIPRIQPYAICQYSQPGQTVRVGFVGISTPESLSKSLPDAFKENGEFVYSFYGESAETLYSCAQKNIDACRQAGADYVIAIGHLGISDTSVPFTSTDVIEHTRGLDAFLDGHSHSTIPYSIVKDRDGKEVVLTSTGTKLVAIGRLVIAADGKITSSLVTDVQEIDPEVESVVDNIKAEYEDEVQMVVGQSNTALSDVGDDGCRLVRNRETTIGNFCADACRNAAAADIGIINGGGIRAGLPSGDITYENMISVFPFDHYLACCKCTGQDILNALELGYRLTQEKASDGTHPLGENGAFLAISGIKCTIDTSIPSTVVLDSNGMFVEVSGARRVKDVMVMNSAGEYEPLDPTATYTVASQDYILEECGDGYNMFVDKEYIISEGTADYQVLIDYINSLKGDLSQYSATEGRITVM